MDGRPGGVSFDLDRIVEEPDEVFASTSGGTRHRVRFQELQHLLQELLPQLQLLPPGRGYDEPHFELLHPLQHWRTLSVIPACN
ncbi:hypothetical protein HPB50_003737 [Hyalomma asiaticum]|uniref:Uncharacterized protein n=1 Tax=Hyalomma asiaticum TaxID=266040 RepID=A0ACB7TGL9_HYAAI|nr:hypothetical protein HPB50_003737 [Hyalomma asiaticum]